MTNNMTAGLLTGQRSPKTNKQIYRNKKPRIHKKLTTWKMNIMMRKMN